jgi:hypothetical protein
VPVGPKEQGCPVGTQPLLSDRVLQLADGRPPTVTKATIGLETRRSTTPQGQERRLTPLHDLGWPCCRWTSGALNSEHAGR